MWLRVAKEHRKQDVMLALICGAIRYSRGHDAKIV
jgi:hypothetical protein